jgi:hypothetical protein
MLILNGLRNCTKIVQNGPFRVVLIAWLPGVSEWPRDLRATSPYRKCAGKERGTKTKTPI